MVMLNIGFMNQRKTRAWLNTFNENDGELGLKAKWPGSHAFQSGSHGFPSGSHGSQYGSHGSLSGSHGSPYGSHGFPSLSVQDTFDAL